MPIQLSASALSASACCTPRYLLCLVDFCQTWLSAASQAPPAQWHYAEGRAHQPRLALCSVRGQGNASVICLICRANDPSASSAGASCPRTSCPPGTCLIPDCAPCACVQPGALKCPAGHELRAAEGPGAGHAPRCHCCAGQANEVDGTLCCACYTLCGACKVGGRGACTCACTDQWQGGSKGSAFVKISSQFCGLQMPQW